MLNQVRSRDVMTKDYPISCTFAESSRTQGPDTSGIWDVFSFFEAKELPIRHSIYHSLLRLVEIDLSSVCPRLEPVTGTSLIEELRGEISFEEELEYDVVVRMRPVKACSVRVRITSVERPGPRIVEPEGF